MEGRANLVYTLPDPAGERQANRLSSGISIAAGWELCCEVAGFTHAVQSCFARKEKGPLADDRLHSWLYASHVAAWPAALETMMIDEIIFQSQARNLACAVTGALIFTGGHFAQYIEGPADHVRSIKASILADQRHRGARTISEAMVRERRFGAWAMAYNGQSLAFDKLVSRAYASQGSSGEILLMEMLRRFAVNG